MCAKCRLKSACASAQPDLSPRCPHAESLHPCLSTMRPVKILISLRERAGWSESSLGAHVLIYVSNGSAQIIDASFEMLGIITRFPRGTGESLKSSRKTVPYRCMYLNYNSYLETQLPQKTCCFGDVSNTCNEGEVRASKTASKKRFRASKKSPSSFCSDRSKATPLLHFFCLCVCGSRCGVSVVLICSSSLLLSMPRKGCASWL